MSVIGKIITVSIFGESHGPAIGLTIHGLPSGIQLDLDQIKKDLLLRHGKKELSTPRKEVDEFEIISGCFQGYTTGTPLTFIIKNKDVRESDYTNLQFKPRPSHADLGAYFKYGKFYNFHGGGHQSGRLTALLVVLGSIAKQILAKRNIITVSHIYKIMNLIDDPLNPKELDQTQVNKLLNESFPVINDTVKLQMIDFILQTKNQSDSVGGIIETVIYNVPTGLGEPFFDSVESFLSHLIFSIPGIKGIEFGEGFNIANLYGSQANDEYRLENGKITTSTFHNGGIVGGISIGLPIIFKTAIKPTSSIGKTQKTIDLLTQSETEITIQGRHDPAFISRISIVINAVTNYAILELLAQKEGLLWIK